MIPFQPIDEKWMHPGHNAILVVKEGKVVKKFNNKELYEKEKTNFELLKYYTPHAEFKDDELEIIMEKCMPLVEWIQDKNEQEKKTMAKQILSLVKHLHYRGICHNDFHVNNILVRTENTRDFTPLLIDFENVSKIKNKIEWYESNDVTGEKYMGYDSDNYLSPKLILGFESKELINEIIDFDLCSELIWHSKDSFGAKIGEGLYYSSYHHPLFNHTNSQRNTLERFRFLGVDSNDLKNRIVLDMGCNCAAVSVMAATMGAKEVVGYDNEDRYISLNQKIFKFLKLEGRFEVKNIKELTEIPKYVEVIFALAMSAWVGTR